ncbi:MAG: PKD domain-containing protein [Bacteroidota bacterium]
MNKLLPLVFVIWLIAALTPSSVWAQPFAPESDCLGAIPVCQGVYFQPNSYVNTGANPQEINGANSCLATGERNGAWYIFTVQTSGQLCFDITPVNPTNDYDFAVYDLTNNVCSDIFGNASLEVSCNYSGSTNCNGVTGANGNTSGVCASQNEPCLSVTAGETYALYVSNFSATNQSGYTLDFTIPGTTADIFDNVRPTVDTVEISCSGEISLTFSENVQCVTVDPTDFTVTDSTGATIYPVQTVSSVGCQTGDFDIQFDLDLGTPLANGEYWIIVTDTVLDNCGNPAIIGDSTLITIALPSIAANSSADTVCIGTQFTLSTPATPGFTYIWQPINNAGSQILAVATVLGPQTFIVEATDQNGCVYTGQTDTILVVDPPTANFALPSNACDGDTVTLTFSGSIFPSATLNWDFGGGNVISGSGAGPYEIRWPTTGLKTVNLTLNQFGCSAANAQLININDIPDANFTVEDSLCITSQATAAYTGSAPPSANYVWDFDGGTQLTGSGQGPVTAEWVTPGFKTVCLTVEENGCISEPNCQTVRVDALPTVTISGGGTAQCLKGNEFTFEYKGPNVIQGFQWDLGEVGAISTSAMPTYAYNSFGLKEIVLTVVDNNGCQNTASDTVEVFPPITANFTFDNICFGNPTPFTNQSVTFPSGPQASSEWSFGDGATSTDFNTNHTYGLFGEFEVTYIATTVNGCKDTLVDTVEVFDQPLARFVSDNACDNDAVPFSDQSQFNTPSLNYGWNFGFAGGSSSLASPSPTYPGPGTYSVTLTVSNDDGCLDSETQEVTIYPDPVAAFSVDAAACEDSTLTLSNNSTVDNPQTISAYLWKFGNGIESTDIAPQPVYSDLGTYPLTLIAVSDQGCVDTLTQDLTIHPNPTASFTVEDICIFAETEFISTSTVDESNGDFIQSFVWNTGDGGSTISTGNYPYTYNQSGNFIPQLTVITDKGCTNVIAGAIEIYPAPLAPTGEDVQVCPGEDAVLIANVQGTDKVKWYTSATGGEPISELKSILLTDVARADFYYAESISEQGCISQDRTRLLVSTFEVPEVRLVVSDSLLNLPEATVEFRVETITSGDLATYFWDFGDGAVSNEPIPTHTYDQRGYVNASVDLLTVDGCELSAQSQQLEIKELRLLDLPSAFTPDGDFNNDTYYVNTQLIEQIDFAVFNRWGQQVFQTNDLGFRWDGRGSNGQLVRPGVYVYRVNATDYKGREIDRMGTITIMW